VLDLDVRKARAAGLICWVAKTTDGIDRSVAGAARDRGARVLTSDPDDRQRLDQCLDVIAI
jgi:predicted nucleic acid-binding protein